MYTLHKTFLEGARGGTEFRRLPAVVINGGACEYA